MEKIKSLEQSVITALLPKDDDDERNAVLEIRAGRIISASILFLNILYNGFFKKKV